MTPLPASVQSLLMARVDRLTPADKEVLRAASVMGRRFGADSLARATEMRDIGERLSAMEALDLIHPTARQVTSCSSMPWFATRSIRGF